MQISGHSSTIHLEVANWIHWEEEDILDDIRCSFMPIKLLSSPDHVTTLSNDLFLFTSTKLTVATGLNFQIVKITSRADPGEECNGAMPPEYRQRGENYVLPPPKSSKICNERAVSCGTHPPLYNFFFTRNGCNLIHNQSLTPPQTVGWIRPWITSYDESLCLLSLYTWFFFVAVTSN